MALPEFIRRPFRKHPPQTEQAFSTWFDSEMGQLLLQRQQAVLDEVLPRFFGYHAMLVSCGTTRLSLDRCVVRHQIKMSRDAHASAGLVASPASMPLAKHSLDLVVMHHTLDFAENPHSVLREVAKSVIPGGAMVVIGFNPWSLWGLVRLFRLASSEPPWIGRFIGARRLLDWLGLLGMDIEGFESGWYGLPVAGHEPGSLMERLGERFWHQQGGFYVLVARKNAAVMRPLKQRSQLRERAPNVIPVPLANWERNNRDSEIPD